MAHKPSAYELARIYGISTVAALRGGQYTAKQLRALKKLEERTAKRENNK
ncbi:hypothetical protein [Streptomyces sp. NPDC003032]